MARRKTHEEHANHEAWAIPYGDLITLLLAFFVVMYAMSSVNEGKYRVLSDSLNAAFQGSPKSNQPVVLAEGAQGVLVDASKPTAAPESNSLQPLSQADSARLISERVRAAELDRVDTAVRKSLAPLLESGIVAVNRNESLVEVTIRTDLLFSSGKAELARAAIEPLEQLGKTMAPLPNPIRVEGHTDDVPINTAAFPSNWELSAARAASVVRVMERVGMDPRRLAVVGMGEFRPLDSNLTQAGRIANRRVALVILATGQLPEDAMNPNQTAAPEPPSVTRVTTASARLP
jgi:chemotaxis protein MotB